MAGLEATIERLPVEHSEYYKAAPNVIYFAQRHGSAMDPAKAWVDDYEIRTLNKFVSSTSSIKNPDSSKFVGARIHFYAKSQTQIPIPYDGVPFILLGNKLMDCCQGKNRHKKRQLERVKSRTRKQVQSKKVGCPAVMALRSLVRFPAYKLPEDTRPGITAFSHDKISKKMVKRLQEDLKNGVAVDWEHRVYVYHPPQSVHQNHLTEELGAMTQAMDRRLIGKIKSLVREGVQDVASVKAVLRAYSKENFPEIPESSGRFYPNRKDIKNHIYLSVRALQVDAVRQRLEDQYHDENVDDNPVEFEQIITPIETVIDACHSYPSYQAHSETMIPDYTNQVQNTVPEAMYEVTAPNNSNIYYQQQANTYHLDNHQIVVQLPKPKTPKKAKPKKPKLETIDHNQLSPGFSFFTSQAEPVIEEVTSPPQTTSPTVAKIPTHKEVTRRFAGTKNLDARCKLLLTTIQDMLTVVCNQKHLQAVIGILLKLHIKIRGMIPESTKKSRVIGKHMTKPAKTQSAILQQAREQIRKKKAGCKSIRKSGKNITPEYAEETEQAVSLMQGGEEVYTTTVLPTSTQQVESARFSTEEIYTATQIDTNYLDEGNQSRLNDTENYVQEDQSSAITALIQAGEAVEQIEEMETDDIVDDDTQSVTTSTEHALPVYHRARFIFTPKAPEPESVIPIQLDDLNIKKREKKKYYRIRKYDPIFKKGKLCDDTELEKVYNCPDAEKSSPVVTVGDCVLKKETFDSLKDSLTHEAIDAYMHLLVEGKPFLYLDVINCTQLFHGLPLTSTAYNDVKFGDFKAIIGVVSPKRGHWILLVILPDQKRMFFLNPLDEININKSIYLQRWFNYLCERHRLQLEPEAPGQWTLDTVTPYSGAMDTSSNGIYILKVAEHYLNGDTFEFKWNEDMLGYERKRIGLLFLTLGTRSYDEAPFFFTAPPVKEPQKPVNLDENERPTEVSPRRNVVTVYSNKSNKKVVMITMAKATNDSETKQTAKGMLRLCDKRKQTAKKK